MVPDNKVKSIIASLLIKQDLCNQPNLQEYLKTEKKATGKVFKGSQSFLELRYLAQWRSKYIQTPVSTFIKILQTDLYTFP